MTVKLVQPRIYSLVYLVLGAAAIFLALDLQFFHFLDYESDSLIPFIAAISIGICFFVPSLKNLIIPPTLFVADESGITLFSSQNDSAWNDQERRFVKVQNLGEPRSIRWQSIVSIKVVDHVWISNRRALSGTNQVARTPDTGVRILLLPEVRLDGFTREGLLATRSAIDGSDISSEDRQYYSDEQLSNLLYSEVFISRKILPRTEEQFCKRLCELKMANSDLNA